MFHVIYAVETTQQGVLLCGRCEIRGGVVDADITRMVGRHDLSSKHSTDRVHFHGLRKSKAAAASSSSWLAGPGYLFFNLYCTVLQGL